MAQPKALLPVRPGGETFLARLVATMRAAGVEDVVVVIGCDAPVIVAAVASTSLPVRLIENREYTRGQLSSLWAGLAVVDRPGVRGVLVTPVDMPLVSPGTVQMLLDVHRRTGASVVRPAKAGRHGHPVLFDRALFDELRRADPAVGARAALIAHANSVVNVAVEDDGAFLDIDTPEEYARLIARFYPGTGRTPPVSTG